MNKSAVLFLMVAVLVISGTIWGQVGTAFKYQGRLMDGGTAAEGFYDFEFELYDAAGGNIQVGPTLAKENVGVYAGYFTVPLDFGVGIFAGDPRWLQIGVRPGELSDPCEYTNLSPRQELTPTPYAIYAANAGSDADWIVTPPDMHAGVTGNVGIGVMIPNYKLEVVGAIKGTSGLFGTGDLDFGANLQAANRINIMDGVSSDPMLYIGDNNIQYLQLQWNSVGDYAQLSTSSGSDFSIMPGGNVGIGTHTPAERFEVIGGATETPDQANTSWNDEDGEGWQSFTAGINGKLSKIAMYGGGFMDRWGIGIYSGEGTGGTLLYTHPIVVQAFGVGWHSITLSSAIDVQAGQIYTIALFAGEVHWKYSTSNPYAQGRSSLDSGYDYTFRTYVLDPGTPGKVLQASANGEVYLAHNDAGRVGIGTNSPGYKLDVEGEVQAYAYHTGDIIFQKDGRKLWRMFEDEQGLYVESLSTGKVYEFVLRERKPHKADSSIYLEKAIKDLQGEVKYLKAQLQTKK
ncbi:hypothetical protein ACFL02_06395 [Planctomycetota bacterium]